MNKYEKIRIINVNKFRGTQASKAFKNLNLDSISLVFYYLIFCCCPFNSNLNCLCFKLCRILSFLSFGKSFKLKLRFGQVFDSQTIMSNLITKYQQIKSIDYDRKRTSKPSKEKDLQMVQIGSRTGIVLLELQTI